MVVRSEKSGGSVGVLGVKLNATKKDYRVIGVIAERAVRLSGGRYKVIDAELDITACHLNGNPLDLDRLLAADDFNFAHDVFGIRRHLDRETGKLTDFFVPRFSHRKTDNPAHIRPAKGWGK